MADGTSDLKSRTDRWRERLIVAALYVAVLAITGPRVKLSQWDVRPDHNHAAAEALAWLDGHLDVPVRGGDVADYHGKYYLHFPPLFTFICYAVFGLHRLVLGDPPVFWGLLYALIVAVPIPYLAYRAIRHAGLRAEGAALLTGYFICGTCLWPVAAILGGKHGSWVYSTQLLLAQSGIAIFLIDYFGKRRYWLGGLGILIAAWSRQTTIAYSVALLAAAWRAPDRKRALLKAGIPLAVAVAVPMVLSWAKFGSPFESGYRYIYVGRDDMLARRARGPNNEPRIFDWRFIPENAYYYHLCPPDLDLTLQGLKIYGRGYGTSLWIGSPLLLLLLWDAKRWWRQADRRVLVICTLIIHAALLAYHYTGYDYPGYCRYTLDFTLPWLAVIAPGIFGPRRTAFTLACVTWSVFYFYMII